MLTGLLARNALCRGNTDSCPQARGGGIGPQGLRTVTAEQLQ